MASKNLIQALAVTAELCGGTELSELAAKAFIADLEIYPEAHVIAALALCRKELTGRLTLAAVLQRIPGQHPGAEEAWAIASRGGTSESVTKVWTSEMFSAFLAVQDVYDAEGPIPARMAFKEIYLREIAAAKAAGRQIVWTVSVGHDAEDRKSAIDRAIQSGYITVEDVPTALRHLLDVPAMGAKDALRLAVNNGVQVSPQAQISHRADPEVIDANMRKIMDFLGKKP